jgi:deazaflavin-dependent oxidoreductase (nitroreductase family)
VTGRKSGRPRTTPVALGEGEGRRWLVANYGEVNWVRNLRATGRATLTRGRRSEAIAVEELPPAQAAPLLRQAVALAPPPLRKRFTVAPDAALDAFERAVADHPVFLIRAPGDEGRIAADGAS